MCDHDFGVNAREQNKNRTKQKKTKPNDSNDERDSVERESLLTW